MDQDQIVRVILAFLGTIAIPWIVFVTINIFNLKQQIALIKQEIQLLHRIETFLQKKE
jgi:hypothetical protein